MVVPPPGLRKTVIVSEQRSESGYENRLLAALPPDEAARLAPYLVEREFRAAEVVAQAGEPIEVILFPYDLVTSTVTPLPSGEVVEVGLMGAEGITGLDVLYGQNIAHTTVIVQIPGRGAVTPAADFVREIVAPAGRGHAMLLRYANTFMAMVAQVAACNAVHPADQRLARWLCMAHDRVRRERFSLTHEYVSMMLGVRRATITTSAAMLRSAGAIDYHRGNVTVLDRHALERAACSCYPVLRKLGDEAYGLTS